MSAYGLTGAGTIPGLLYFGVDDFCPVAGKVMGMITKVYNLTMQRSCQDL
ncbi:Uncharacterised protein [Chryseobacterium nakagawai]|nr:Uncharacterised protein [Chryseobacterium nakagawai]